jgi:hypothetical protein
VKCVREKVCVEWWGVRGESCQVAWFHLLWSKWTLETRPFPYLQVSDKVKLSRSRDFSKEGRVCCKSLDLIFDFDFDFDYVYLNN